MSFISAGRDIDYRCSRCKLELAHTIIAVVNGVPARVKCNTCHTERKYRAPRGGEKPPVRRRPVRASTSTSGSKSLSHQSADWSMAEQWKALMSRVEATGSAPRLYSMRETYAEGEAILHRKFGVGYVTGVADAGKIRVYFRDGERLLVHGRG